MQLPFWIEFISTLNQLQLQVCRKGKFIKGVCIKEQHGTKKALH